MEVQKGSTNEIIVRADRRIVCKDDRNSLNEKAYYEFSAVSPSGTSSLGTSLS